MGKKLLLVVDMQNDYVYGALGTKESASILPHVLEKIKEYQANGDQIIFTQDTHFEPYQDSQEGKYLPVIHCIKGSKGWRICDAIQEIAPPNEYTVYEKMGFGSSTLANDLANFVYHDLTAVEIIGAGTEFGILSNAVLFKTFYPELPVSICTSCCAGVTPESHKRALKTLQFSHFLLTES